VPLLAVVAAMLVLWFPNSMTMLLRSPLGPIGVQKQEHPNLIFFVECPRFMALATGGGGRFCQGRAFVARSSQRSGDPLQVLPPLPSPLPEAGVLRRERNLVTLPYCCTLVRT